MILRYSLVHKEFFDVYNSCIGYISIAYISHRIIVKSKDIIFSKINSFRYKSFLLFNKQQKMEERT